MKLYEVSTTSATYLLVALDDMQAAFVAHDFCHVQGQKLLDVTPMSNKKYLPNRWKRVKDLPEEFLEPCSFEELMEMKPSFLVSIDHYALIRTENLESGRIKEYAYKLPGAFANRLQRLLLSDLFKRGKLRITFADEQQMFVLERGGGFEL